MKKTTKVRIAISVAMIALAVVLGIVLDGVMTGPESQMWQRMVYIFVIFGTGFAGLIGLFTPKGFLWGYGWIGIIVLTMVPDVLPEPWDRYSLVAMLAAVFIWLGVKNGKRKSEPTETAEYDEEPTEEELKLTEQYASHIIVMNPMNSRFYQLFCRNKELLAYRVGSQLKGIVEELLQTEYEELRTLGKYDFSIQLSNIRSVRMIGLYGGILHDQAVVKARRKTYRFTHIPLNDRDKFIAFWKDMLHGKVTEPIPKAKREELSEQVEEEFVPDEKRLAVLRIVKICYGVYLGAVNLAWLFLDVPYGLFSMLSVAALPILMILYFCFPNEFSLGEGRIWRNKLSLVFLMSMSGFAPMLRTLIDFNIMNTGRFLLVSAIVYVLFFVLFLACSKEWKKQKIILLALAFVLLYYAAGAVGQLNYVLDNSKPIKEQGVVTDLRSSDDSEYYLLIALPDGEEIELRTSESHYNSLKKGDEVTVCTFSGALGIPYSHVH